MRLINIHTLKIEEFLGSVPPYAILSHTWGTEEVTLQQYQDGSATSKAGWRKIVDFCALLNNEVFARKMKDHHVSPTTKVNPGRKSVDYAWVDTCCIDKTSSADLSEAINAMFRWYADAEFCVVYLEDYRESGNFPHCRWFTRGWTLQELLAPGHVYFFDFMWRLIGTKETLLTSISEITKIPPLLIGGPRAWAHVSIAQKMSWAANRQTTRIEDRAYSLMGIFDVNMPLLYGEGEKAFIRLQEEIIKEYDDCSIMLWDASKIDPAITQIGAFAPSPEFFGSWQDAERMLHSGEMSVTNKGVKLHAPMIQDEKQEWMAVVLYKFAGSSATSIGIPVEKDKVDRTRQWRRRAPLARLTFGMDNKNNTVLCIPKRSSRAQSIPPVRQTWLKYNEKVIKLISMNGEDCIWQYDNDMRQYYIPTPVDCTGIIQAGLSMNLTGDDDKENAVVFLTMDINVRDGGGKVWLTLEDSKQLPADERRDWSTTKEEVRDLVVNGVPFEASLVTDLPGNLWTTTVKVNVPTLPLTYMLTHPQPLPSR